MRTSTGRRALAVFGTAALLALTATPALADDRGSTTATINIAVRSITVTPNAVTYGSCFDINNLSTADGLTFPNGRCVAPTPIDGVGRVAVVNGNVPGHIDVEGADAIPADGGQHWTLTVATPSQDEFWESTGHALALSTTPICDTSVSSDGNCDVVAGQEYDEWLTMIGPMSSTDPSASFTTTITWLAGP